MRLSIIEMDEDETIFYNLGVFKKHEDLIIFPYTEFELFYQEMELRIRCLRNVINELYQKNADPPEFIRHIDPHLEVLESQIKDLIDYDVQTTLESFTKKPKKESKPSKIIPEIDNEPLQCLMGL